MITINDIDASNICLNYITDDDYCIQYNFSQIQEQDGAIHPQNLTDEQLKDAARQFATILNIAAWDEHLGERIDKHMEINGYEGTSECYKI